MSTNILKDRFGYKIGEIKDKGDILILNDRHGRKMGEFRKSANATFDRNGYRIGQGNLLATLL